MVYKYKDHQDIPNYMRAYLMDVVDADYLEEVDIEDINDFLNGLEVWEDDYDVEVPSYLNHIH
jgi:hypothetical protein